VAAPSPVVAPPEPQPDEAIAAWEAAAAADPTAIDPLYNAGLAHYQRREFAAALAAWERALARDPRDFAVHRKIVQAQHALGRHADAERSMIALRALWKTSTDPATRAVDEVVFDQFAVGDVAVHAFETLRPRDPSSYALLTFRTAAEPTRPSIAVRVETSDYARERGVPYVLSVTKGREYKVIGTSAQLPPYPDLKQTVAKLITQALA
jgi:tetratricopeptide (TPR) repeat protein